MDISEYYKHVFKNNQKQMHQPPDQQLEIVPPARSVYRVDSLWVIKLDHKFP